MSKVFYVINSAKGFVIKARKEIISNDGNIISKIIYIKTVATKKEANDVISSLSIIDYSLTLKDLFISYYDNFVNSISKYETKELKYCFNLTKDIHNMLIDDINIDRINEFISNISSKATYKRVRTYLNKMLLYGFQKNILKSDYSQMIVKKKSFEFQSKNNNHQFTTEEISNLLNDYSDELTRDIIAFTILTKVPSHIILNLRKKEVLFDEKRIVVNYRTRKVKKVFDLNNEALDILKKYLNKNPEYFFTNKKGRRLEYSVYRRYYLIPFLKRHNLEKVKISDFYNINIERSVHLA